MTFSRRDLFSRLLTPPKPAPRPVPAPTPTPAPPPVEATPAARPRRGSMQVEHVPVMWVAPSREPQTARLALWLSGGIAGMNASGRELDALADAGFTAISFDSWQRGTRAPESMAAFYPRMIENFPQVAWPIYGNSALETLRILDWAAEEFGIEPPFYLGGYSAGGDIVVAAAGLDPRIGCVAAICATPDWRRPGMHAEGRLVGPGKPDAYAQWLYDRINPLTHADAYAHRPAITFECGADDDHVPPDGAQRFREALLAGPYAGSPGRIRVGLHAGIRHEYTPEMWENCLAWFRRHAEPDKPG
jgi:dienelactone hydrolase